MVRSRHRPLWFVAAALVVALPLALVVFTKAQAGGAKMPEIRFHKLGASTVVTAEVRKLRPADADAAAAQPAQPRGSGYFCPFANQQRNSRSPHSLPLGKWSIRWRVDCATEVQPAFVLTEGSWIYVHGKEWRVYAGDGKALFSGISGGGPVVLDTAAELIYRMAGGGEFAATRLEDGKSLFQYLPNGGDKFSRTMIVRRGGRYIMGANERQLSPYEHMPARESILEILDVAEPVETTDLGTLTTGTANGVLQFPSTRMNFATVDDTILASAPDWLYVIDFELTITRAIETGLEVEMMSLDEAGRIYLLSKADDRYSVHLLTQEGHQIYGSALPPQTPEPTAPPIVSYDHRVFLLTANQIIALGADGKIDWTRSTTSPIAGAIVTPDGHLVVAEGDAVTSWDKKGERELLFATGGDRLLAPPVLNGDGEILVISKAHLYCLSVRAEEPVRDR